MEKRRVLITGLGTVNPLGHNAADTWQAVRDGVCGIGPITRYDCSAQKVHLAAEVKDWDPTTVLDKKDVRHMSRYVQLAAAAAKEALAALLPVLEAQADWNRDAIFEACKTLAEQMEKKNGWLLFPLGIALSGKARTPGGGTDLAAMMGKEETIVRVKAALEKL